MYHLSDRWKGARAALVATAVALLGQGCTVYSYDTATTPYYTTTTTSTWVVETNSPPAVISADAGVYWDAAYFDDIWYFDAVVDDYNGAFDVLGVWADVYDECAGGVLVQSFELYPTSDPFVWSAEYFGSDTWLDPYYSCYTVDLVAYDVYEDYGWMTIWAATY